MGQPPTAAELNETTPGADHGRLVLPAHLRIRATMPRPQARIVIRPRLFTLLNAIETTPVMVVTGPSGWGKTQLLLSWLDSDNWTGDVAWLQLDVGDNDPLRFWRLFLGAVNHGTSSANALLENLDATPYRGAPNELANLAAEALTLLDRPLVIVIDDVHLLSGAEVVRDLEYLMLHLPAECKMILSGLYMPGIRTSRMRLNETLVTITLEDLAFRPDEASEILQTGGVPLSDEVSRLLCEKTEGWCTGLRLAALSLAGGASVERILRDMDSGASEMGTYLAEEVLDRLPDELQDFLVRTSVCEQISGELAYTLTGQRDSPQILESLAQQNIFTVALPEPGWYSYHSLFLRLLNHRLNRVQSPTAAQLHLRAAMWKQDHGMSVGAFEHAVAAEAWDTAVGVLRDIWLSTYLDGQLIELRRLLEALPLSIRLEHPEIIAVEESVEAFIDEAQDADRLVGSDRPVLQIDEEKDLTVAELVVLLEAGRRRGNLRRVQRAATALLELAADPQVDASRRNDYETLALSNLGVTEYWSGDNASAEGHLRRALHAARANGRDYIVLRSLSQLMGVLTAQSRPNDAEKLSVEAIHLATVRGWERASSAAELWHVMGWIHYLRCDLEGADRFLAKAAAAQQHDTPVGIIILTVQALIAGLRGHREVATRLLNSAQERLGEPRDSYIFLTYISGELARHAIASGDLPLARTYLGPRPDGPDGPLHMSLAWAEYYVATAQAGKAEELLGAAVQRGSGFLDQRLQVWARLALMQAESGQVDIAVTTIADALRAATEEDMLQPFCQFGGGMTPLVRAAGRRYPDTCAMADRVIHAFARIHDAAEAVMPTNGELTEREMDVLRHLDGLSSLAELAEQMFVSVNTIKTHVRNVYAKIGVGSRREAVAEARRRGWM